MGVSSCHFKARTGHTARMPLHITRLIFRQIAMPLREPFKSSAGELTERPVILVEAVDAHGISGWGECVALPWPDYLPETVDTVWLALEHYIGPLIAGRPLKRSEDVIENLDSHIRGHNMAKAAVEMAVWELAARIEAVPLAQILGGERKQIAAGVVIGIQSSHGKLLDKVARAMEDGYQRVKLKIGPGNDLEHLRAIRDKHKKLNLAVDGNCAYSLQNLDTLKQLGEFDLDFIEQPLAWDDFVGHATLQSQLETPVCLDESVQSLAHAETMRALGSGRIVNIKPGKMRGFTRTKAILDYCAQHGIPAWCGGMLETGIGRAHNVALATLKNFTMAGDVSPSARYWRQDIVTPDWTMDANGMIDVPWSQPGMGVEVNTELVERLTVRKAELTVN